MLQNEKRDSSTNDSCNFHWKLLSSDRDDHLTHSKPDYVFCGFFNRIQAIMMMIFRQPKRRISHYLIDEYSQSQTNFDGSKITPFLYRGQFSIHTRIRVIHQPITNNLGSYEFISIHVNEMHSSQKGNHLWVCRNGTLFSLWFGTDGSQN